MRKHPSLKSWVGTITRKMPHLSKPQAKVLAMWSFGIAITQSSGLTTVSIFLAKLLNIKENDEVSSCHPNQPEHSEPASGSATYSSTSLPRKLSCFRRGFLSILVTLLWGQTLPLGHFYSFPWTDTFSFSSA